MAERMAATFGLYTFFFTEVSGSVFFNSEESFFTTRFFAG
jgi:hypothetical protein